MRSALAALLVVLTGCTGGDPAPAPTPTPVFTTTQPGPTAPIFDPAAMEAALLAAADLPGWESVGEATTGITGLFRFCGGSWTGLEGARGPRERVWNDEDGSLLMQDVRVYDGQAAARTAVSSLVELTGDCAPDSDEVRPADDVPRLGDASHAFGMTFLDRDVYVAFVVSGRYGTVVVTDADDDVRMVREAAAKLRDYARANP